MAPQKRLSWEEWQRRANADYVKGEFGVQQMIASWGYPEGMSAETHKLEFDKGKAKRKDRAGRRAQRAKATVKRQEVTATQTVGKDVYGKGVVTQKGSGLQEHHKRIVNVYAPFFEGLNPKETKELAQWFDDEGFPLGNVKKNLEAATEIEHEAIHTWARDNFIEPKTGKPLLNFKNYTLNERLVPALTFLEQVQPAVDEKLSEIKSTAVKPKSNLMPSRRALTPNVSDVEALGRYRGGKNIGMNLMPDPRSALRAVKENPRGAAAGVAMSALNPEVAQQLEQNNLGQAGLILGKDVALSTTGEAGLKAGLGVASKYIPTVAKAAPTLAKIGGVVGPAGTGAALFAQGQRGSLTDVLTRKAAQNPVSFMPSVQANPETDIGARASRAIVNEAKYLSKQAAKAAKPLIDAAENELRWLGKAGQRAFSNIFGNREI